MLKVSRLCVCGSVSGGCRAFRSAPDGGPIQSCSQHPCFHQASSKGLQHGLYHTPTFQQVALTFPHPYPLDSGGDLSEEQLGQPSVLPALLHEHHSLWGPGHPLPLQGHHRRDWHDLHPLKALSQPCRGSGGGSRTLPHSARLPHGG